MPSLDELTADELRALRGAASWYAQYRAHEVSERATDRTLRAEVEREEYLALLTALKKLGAPMAVPDALREHVPAVA